MDIGRSDTYCIGAPDTVWLTRPPAERPAIALRRGGNRRSLAWPKGATRVEWAADLSIEDGGRFEVLAGDRPMAVLTFRIPLAGAASDTAGLAEALLLGCREQHAAALRSLAASLLPLEIFLVSERRLPPGLLAGHGEPLPERLGATLDDNFTSITAGRVGAAQLGVHVEDR